MSAPTCTCPEWWHQVLTAPPQTVTREQLDARFREEADDD